MARAVRHRLASGVVVAVVGAVTIAAGCAPATARDESRDTTPGSVSIEDAAGDVQTARSDSGPAPHGGVDLLAASLRDGGDVLVVEFTLDGGHGPSATGPPAPSPSPPGPSGGATSPERVYVLRLWGVDPADRFTLHAVGVARDGTAAVAGDAVHRCGVIHALHSCAPVETDAVGTVVRADLQRVVFEVPWTALGRAGADGFRWMAGAQSVAVAGERWDAWFDDVPDRLHPMPELDGQSATEELLRGDSIDPPTTAASFPARATAD